MSFFNFSSGYLSPPKKPSNARSPTSPFCTSPSQLQEVTLGEDATFSNTMGLRSPSGPMRGRSVKEFEEQLTNLKKENFNLKLRIYFLEEKMGTNFTLDKDNVVKKNIELQVEVANLQKQIEEKHELLCQAVRAMELEEEEHKKYMASKEEQLNLCQQELDDLRMQLQLQLYKENNASFQIIFGQAETLKCRYENMQKEVQAKDETIKTLTEEIDSTNEKMIGFSEQIKELQGKLDSSIKENQQLNKTIQMENKKFEELMGQITDLKKKYAMAKAEVEREHKRVERVKMTSEVKISELEEENEKQKIKIRDLQGKLEAAVLEIKKNQNLAVSKSLVQQTNTSNTDVNSFSVSNSTTSSGTQEKNSLHVQISSTLKLPISPLSPSSPEKFDTSEFEKLLQGTAEAISKDKILSHIQLLKSENAAHKQKIIKLKSEQIKACEIIKNMIDTRNKASEEITQLRQKIEQLEHELESVVSKPTSDGTELPLQQRVANLNITAANPTEEKIMAESQTEDVAITEHYKALTEELEAKIEVLLATLNEKNLQIQNVLQQYDEILTTLEEKENRIVDLEFELVSLQQGGNNVDRSLLEKGDCSSEKHSSFYRQEMEEKDKEIKRLNTELKKCTSYLQEIVNKELWEKNKEIEKLHNKQANSSEIVKLKKELTGKELQLKILKEKIGELGLDITIPAGDSCEAKDLVSPSKNIHHIKTLQDHLKACKDERDYFKQKAEELEYKEKDSDVAEKLQEQNEKLKTEIDMCEKLRLESNEVCTVLSTRLKELAVFLDSLLKQKSVLGFLGIQKNRQLREIIDNSLDLSRSFSVSMMINPDQSLAQLSNITGLLNDSVFQDLTLDIPPEEGTQEVLSIIPANATLTYQSHLYKQTKDSELNNEQVIIALREQIVNLKSELQLRDNELNKLNNVNNKEVSDKTTETDEAINNKSCLSLKDVSRLFTTSNKSITTLKQHSECQSESEAWSEPDRVISRARIGLSQTLPASLIQTNENVNESTEEECGSSTTPSKRSWGGKRLTVCELQQQIYIQQEEIKRQAIELTDIQTRFCERDVVTRNDYENLEKKFKETEENLIEADTKRTQAENQFKSLRKVVDDLMKSKKELQESTEVKDKETQNKINQLEVEKEQAAKTAQEFEKQVAEAKNEIKNAQTKLKQTQEEIQKIEINLRKEYEQYTIVKLKDAEEQFLRKIKQVEEKAEEKVKQIKEEYSRDFVKKCDVEMKLMEVDRLIHELDELKSIVKSYEETVDAYKLKENEIGNKLHEYQDKINNLRRDLDNTTLQYSEAVLEKTKLANEKTLLEQELSKINIKDSEMKQQYNDMEVKFSVVNQNYHQIQKQKLKLEVKISELESANAELHNKLVKLQSSYNDLNMSLPNIANKSIQVLSFRRQFSDQNYSSEDNAEERSHINFSHPMTQKVQPVDMERQEANASPDLGIESDHGRFSSLENHANIPRPLLQTIELTESMNNLLDGDHNPVESVTCESEHCCQKTLEIAHENNDLKRKLLRMRRALEETANQLNLANQRKKQVEKTICKQIHKTSQVLRKAKANLDSGSESDVFTKM